MRQNLPVTGIEVPVPEGDEIVSRTDLKGRIVYVNPAFVRISGFTEAELIGQPHNIIRHPDMPAAAFADLWATLKAGRPWVGMVKNRCRNGDHYWVLAHAAPVFEGGELVGYMSVRRAPTRAQVTAAERDYAALRAGSCTQELRQGRLCDPTPWYIRYNPLWKLSLRARLLMSAFGMGVYGVALLAMFELQAPAWLVIATIVLGTVFAAYCAWWLARDVVGRLEEANRQFRRLASGLYDGDIPIDRNDEIGSILLSLKSTQVRLGFEMQDAARRNAEAARITSALDAAEVNMMIADERFDIIYANPAMRAMLKTAEADLRKALPEFAVERLIGSNMDVFHRDPAHQRAMLARLDRPHRATIAPGGRRFQLLVTPVFDPRGQRIGVVTEWRDLTLSMGSLQHDVAEVVNAAANGDFSRRIRLDDQDGFLQVLGSGVNTLLATTEGNLRETLQVITAMSDGDLRPRITSQMHGLFAEMKDSTNATLDRLSTMVRQIRDASGDIHSASQEIASGNLDLSLRTEQQAAALEETASSMEEMTSTVRQSAQNAREANELAAGASVEARQGGEIVQRVVATMGQIHDASTKVGDIVSVIDSIAFQTNILALNAAVEAARAGDQGRGFAVVAAEVRSLAQRSATAAREIKQLIAESTQRVSDGRTLVGQAGDAMNDIVHHVGTVSGLVSQIAAAAQEQSAGIEQVNRAITHMDEGTQQNAALVEEASASAKSLEQQAAQLVDAVAVFRLDGDGVATGPRGAAQSATVPGPKGGASRPASTRVPATAGDGRSR